MGFIIGGCWLMLGHPVVRNARHRRKSARILVSPQRCDESCAIIIEIGLTASLAAVGTKWAERERAGVGRWKRD